MPQLYNILIKWHLRIMRDSLHVIFRRSSEKSLIKKNMLQKTNDVIIKVLYCIEITLSYCGRKITNQIIGAHKNLIR